MFFLTTHRHSEWRKLAKKARRKRIRRKLALIRDEKESEEHQKRERSPSYQKWLQEQKEAEEFQVQEEQRLSKEQNEKFLESERLAQVQWKELQIKLRLVREERRIQNEKIKLEWEAEQSKLRKLQEEKERQQEERRLQELRLQEEIEEFINSNGKMPEQLKENMHSNPGKQACPFFSKLAACRFGDACSRDHIRPTISRILLLRNFYSHYSLNSVETEHGDSNLEYEVKELYNNFKEFFEDVLPEFEKFGSVRQLKVCCNKESHLRGNVYVEYSTSREAIQSYRKFQGRFYGGKRLNVEFCLIESWKSAICGLFFRKRCPKGSVCNFLHVFRNPGNAFFDADRDLHRTPPREDRRSWRWSESPEMEIISKEERSRSHRRRKHKDEKHRSHRSKRKRSREKRKSHKSNTKMKS